MIRYFSLLILFVSIFSISAFAKEKEPVLIGAMLHVSGDYSMQGNAFREGIELAVDKVNKSGGIKGRLLKVIYEDTQYNMKNVHTISTKLINLDKISAAIISNYTEVMTAGPAFEAAKIPLITLWDSAPEIENIGDYVFGIGIWAPATTDVAVKTAMGLGAKTAVCISTNGQWSLTTTEEFAKKFKAAGGKVLNHFSANPGDSDFRTIILKAKTLKPDVIYAPVADNIPAFFTQLSRSGYKGIVLSSDVINQEIIDATSGATEGIYHTQMADPSHSEALEMQKEYKAKFGKECKQVMLTAWGYDAIMMYADVIAEYGDDPEAIKQGLYKVKGFKGASGEKTIDSKGSSRSPVYAFKIQDGKFKRVNRDNDIF